ncbi:hypothetical protein QFC22_003833 [Naganishia vaughanmartiniae]|uniref:Uncharacterized protein n=1 Tax=Naganishia vaughanmartiniae TaxID=1424756 RepID=A0ACC2X3K6_9TREE|nr:hypothetical protein QFC22_003833 [Naganishia vaughanmartiniae]
MAKKARPQSLIINLKHVNAAIHAKSGGQASTGRATQAFLGWSGLASASSLEMYGNAQNGKGSTETIEMDPEVAAQLGWAEGDLVEIGLLPAASKARSVSVTPMTADDWEVLELHTNYLENNLLSQMRAATTGAVVNVWVLGKTKIKLKIDETSPATTNQNAVLITPDTEIFVAPRPRKPKAAQPAVKKEEKPPNKPVATASIKQATTIAHDTNTESTNFQQDSATTPSTADLKLPKKYIKLRSTPSRVFRRWPDLREQSSQDETRHVAWTSKKTFSAVRDDFEASLESGKASKAFDNADELPVEVFRLHAAVSEPTENVEEDTATQKEPKRVKVILRPFEGMPDGDVAIWPRIVADGASSSSSSSDWEKLGGASGSGKTVIAKSIAATLEVNRKLPMETIYVDCKLSQLPQGSLATVKQMIEGWIDEVKACQPCLLILDNIEKVLPVEVEQADNTRTRTIAEFFVNELAKLRGLQGYVLLTATSTNDIHTLLRTKHVFGKTIELKAPNSDMRRQILGKILSMRHHADTADLDLTTVAHEAEGYTAADLSDMTENALQKLLLRQLSSGSPVNIADEDFEAAIAEYKPRSLREVKLQKSDVQWSDIGGLHETRRVLRETLEWPTKYSAIFAKCPLRLRSGLLLYGYPGCGKTLLASAVAKECGLNFISVKGPELLNKYIGASEKSVRDVFERALPNGTSLPIYRALKIQPKTLYVSNSGHDSTGVTDRVVNQLLTEMDGAEGLDGVYVLAATSRPDLIDAALLRPGRLDKSLLCGMPDAKDRLEIMCAVSRKISLDSSVDLEEYVDSTQGFSGADLQALIYNAQLEAVHDIVDEDRHGSSSVQTKEQSGSFDGHFQVWKAGEMHGSKAMAASERSVVSKQVDNLIKASAASAEQGEGGNVKPVLARSQPVVKEHHLERSLDNTKPSLPMNERRRLDKM